MSILPLLSMTVIKAAFYSLIVSCFFELSQRGGWLAQFSSISCTQLVTLDVCGSDYLLDVYATKPHPHFASWRIDPKANHHLLSEDSNNLFKSSLLEFSKILPSYSQSLLGQGSLNKHWRFCKNCQNRYCDNTRQAKNCQNQIMMIPSRYCNHIGGNTWYFVDTSWYHLMLVLSCIVWYC